MHDDTVSLGRQLANQRSDVQLMRRHDHIRCAGLDLRNAGDYVRVLTACISVRDAPVALKMD